MAGKPRKDWNSCSSNMQVKATICSPEKVSKSIHIDDIANLRGNKLVKNLPSQKPPNWKFLKLSVCDSHALLQENPTLPTIWYVIIYIYLLYLLQVNSRTLPTFSVMTFKSFYFLKGHLETTKISRNEYRKPAKKYFYHAYLDHVDHFVFLSDLKRQVRCGVLWWKLKCCCRFLGWRHGRCEFLILGLGWLVCSRCSELMVVLFSGGKVWLILFYIYIRAGWGGSFI